MAYSSAPKPAYSLPCMAMVAIVSFLVIFFADLSAREAFFKVHEDDAANVVHEDHPVPVPGPNVPVPVPVPVPKETSVLASRRSTLNITANPCAGAQPKGAVGFVPGLGDYNFSNRFCFDEGIEYQAGADVTAGIFPQAAGDVTKGYKGKMVSDLEPINDRYFKTALCPVNVHWHLGAEHRSEGQYDESGTGPEHKDGDIHHRRKLAGKVRQGNQCKLYNKDDAKFTKPYNWQYCKDMEVGQTYEVHWPHSALGACGTPHQYQYPFYDGVFCRLGDFFAGGGELSAQAIASTVGVQGQVFTIVNDEQYYYDNLIGGMIVDGDFGKDMAVYTGSTTGTSRDNRICSMYAPITWQVDRSCHMISASSFDKMCADMQAQQDDMAGDTHPHGSRVTVIDELTANNGKDLGSP